MYFYENPKRSNELCWLRNIYQHLEPELKRDITVDVQYLSAKYKTYAEYTLKSQKSRLSKGRSIFRNGEVCDALMLIINNGKVSSELKYKAEKFLEQEHSQSM